MGSHVRLKIWLIHIKVFLFLLEPNVEGAVMAPPWANPKLNPCAAQPRGWQLLFWPPDGRCYKIFQLGHPCPEGMELTPSVSKSGGNISTECRCPPNTAQSASDGKCYELFSTGPCSKGYFFGPDAKYKGESSKRQWGICKQLKSCSNYSMIYWPKNGQCYQRLSRGPCPKGQLLFMEPKSGIPICGCGEHKELADYRHEDGRCYQHFTKGPCWENGHLFLPNKTCGCYNFLPQYHKESQQCFELETPGPCGPGQLYKFQSENNVTHRARCECKPGHQPHSNSTHCYRPYTRGPCRFHQIFVDDECVERPCEKGYLYFPDEKRCYRIGTRGPCPRNGVVTFDFETRPSVDGISYNGVCGCENKDCNVAKNDACNRSQGLIRYKTECHKMYTQGPCHSGAWLVPKREPRHELFNEGRTERTAICECIPGYSKIQIQKDSFTCMPPTVILANYLNNNYSIQRIVLHG